MNTDATEIRDTLHLRERAEERSTRGGRRLLCLGRVTAEGIVVWQAENGTVFYVAKQRSRSECAWCGKVIREGSEPVSHGICDECAGDHFGGAA